MHCARKTGVEKASGDYIVFIDPDDSFDQDALRLLKGALDSGNIDVLHYGNNNGKDRHLQSASH